MARSITPIAFEVLLSLSDRERHGYDIMRDVERRSGETVHPGTLYRTIRRLEDDGLLKELEDRPAPELDDERRRYYAITAEGRERAREEAERLAALVAAARAKHLLRRSGA